MKKEILTNLNDPTQLEKLYREDKLAFKRAFNSLLPEIQGNDLVGFWNARLNLAMEKSAGGTGKELVFLAFAAIIAGVIAKLPVLLHIDEDYFYPRNIGFIIFPVLSAYFAWKNRLSAGKIAFIVGSMLVGAVFINYLPNIRLSDTTRLSCIHLLLFLWSVMGFAYVGEVKDNIDKRLSYLRYNGDLIVMTTLIVIAGVLLTGATINLFSLIGIRITKFYFNYVVVFGLPAAPILGTYLIQTNPQLVGKISPVIAKIFSPLVFVMLVIYLVAIVYSGKDPYNDREFLLTFNALLIGVIAIIFFSVAETSKTAKGQAEVWVLFLLSLVTIIVSGVALSAILFRLLQWGITPNRVTVFGGNALILINLLFVATRLFKVLSKKKDISEVGEGIALFLPVYTIWAIVVTFLFPLIFEFK